MLALPSFSRSQQPTVLAELFSNFDCANCKIADLTFEDYLSDKPKIVLINYHNASPSPSDPFFMVARQGRSTLYRSDFYAVSADPVAAVNGKVDVGSEPTWESDCTNAKQLPPHTVTAYKDAAGLIYVHVKNTNSIASAQRLNVALLESKIVKANPLAQGVPPSGVWDNIFREMLPTPDGYLFTPTGNDEYTYHFDPTQDDVNLDTWNPDNMQAVAWLQDDQGATKKVEAIGTVSLANLPLGGSGVVATPNQPVPALRVMGNPSGGHAQFWLTLQSPANVRLTLSDMLGREVRVLNNQRLGEGQTSVEMNDSKLASGCYIVRMYVDGTEADHAKLVIE